MRNSWKGTSKTNKHWNTIERPTYYIESITSEWYKNFL